MKSGARFAGIWTWRQVGNGYTPGATAHRRRRLCRVQWPVFSSCLCFKLGEGTTAAHLPKNDYCAWKKPGTVGKFCRSWRVVPSPSLRPRDTVYVITFLFGDGVENSKIPGSDSWDARKPNDSGVAFVFRAPRGWRRPKFLVHALKFLGGAQTEFGLAQPELLYHGALKLISLAISARKGQKNKEDSRARGQRRRSFFRHASAIGE